MANPELTPEESRAQGVIEAAGAFVLANVALYVPDTKVGLAMLAVSAAALLDAGNRYFVEK